MRLVGSQLLLAPTDLSTFISGRHRTGLDLAVAHRALTRPVYEDPNAAILRRREHGEGDESLHGLPPQSVHLGPGRNRGLSARACHRGRAQRARHFAAFAPLTRSRMA